MSARRADLLAAYWATWNLQPIGVTQWTPPVKQAIDGKVATLLSAATGSGRLDPKAMWGDMHVVPGPEPVGPANATRHGYALELRHFPGAPDRQTLAAQTEELLLFDRQLHGTDGRADQGIVRPRSTSNTK